MKQICGKALHKSDRYISMKKYGKKKFVPSVQGHQGATVVKEQSLWMHYKPTNQVETRLC